MLTITLIEADSGRDLILPVRAGEIPTAYAAQAASNGFTGRPQHRV